MSFSGGDVNKSLLTLYRAPATKTNIPLVGITYKSTCDFEASSPLKKTKPNHLSQQLSTVKILTVEWGPCKLSLPPPLLTAIYLQEGKGPHESFFPVSC